jgi:hypothetical protein
VNRPGLLVPGEVKQGRFSYIVTTKRLFNPKKEVSQ